MKRLLIIPLLLLSLTVGARIWYVDESGNDGTGDGSSGNPLALVSYACTQASSGDTIYVNAGTINQGTTQIVKPVGVSITGEGATSIILTSYNNASSLQGAIQCASTAGTTTDDNSSISYIKLDGNSLTSTRAIYVGYRNNVKVHHCTIEDFLYAGVYFYVSGSYPTVYITGCEIHDCTINNSSGLTAGTPASIRLRGTDGFKNYNNVIRNTERANGANGPSLEYQRNKRHLTYNNTFYRNDHEIDLGGTHYWNFFLEEWDYKGDGEFYGNTLYGLAKVSLGGEYNDIESGCTFGYKIYENRFLNTANGNREYNGGEQTIYAINVEGDGHAGVTVTRNYIQNYAIGIELSTPESGAGGYWNHYWDWTNIEISANIIHGVGYADHAYSYGIWWVNESNNYPYYGVFNNVSIINNTITGDNSGSYPGYQGIGIYANDTINDLRASNNIITGFSNYGIYFSEHSTDTLVVDGLDVTYNCMNGNGTNTVGVESGARITITDSDVTTGNITTAPIFKSESTFRLAPSSPCIDAGIDVGLDYDYYGHKITGTPDIGAMEYGRYIMKIKE